jgi:uncharacterized phage protein gp47/JayE
MATFDYTSRDYSAIRASLVTRASRIVPEWNGRDNSDFANVFVDLWAYMGDVLHYYIDRAAGEAFLRTATQRESILAIANLLDYVPSSFRSSTANVTVNVNSAPPDFIIPKGTLFSAQNEGVIYYFSSTTSASGASVGTTLSLNLVQGENVLDEFVGKSSGVANQRFTLYKNKIDIESIEVDVYEGPLVGGSPSAVRYRYEPQLSVSSFSDRVYTAKTNSSGATELIFGSGFNGYIPTNGSEIKASYRSTTGAAGNLPAGRITNVADNMSNYISVSETQLSSAASGGADEESIESIRNNVARLYRTQDRAVSLSDFRELVLQVPGVSKVAATSSGSVVDIYPVTFQTDYPPDPSDDTPTLEITPALQERVENYFSTRTLVGVTTMVNDSINLTPIYLKLTINVLPNYVQRWVKTDVENAIKQLFTFERVDFNQVISVGLIYRAAMNVAGVDYVVIDHLSTTSRITSGDSVGNIEVGGTSMPCLIDDSFEAWSMVGGITGSN